MSKDNDREAIERDIEDLINAKIRPALAEDGGDIQYLSFENGIVYVKLQGNCSTCPYAQFTLKDYVENLLKYYIPEIVEVRQK